MPTEEELEQRVTEHIDGAREAILRFEIETMKKAVEKVENISGLREGKAGKQSS